MHPLIKWAGGKSWLDLPESTGTWIEPFAGGAAQFFKRSPERAILCDSNAHLINMYQQVRDEPDLVSQLLPEQVGDPETYRSLRCAHNSGLCERPERAALVLTLNRTCFNGLWRENKKGEFNVPWCKDPGRAIKRDLIKHSRALKNADLICGDFADATMRAKPGDVVYIDPPYYETFDAYQAGGFSVTDHCRVAIEAARLRNLGCTVWISYNDHPSIRSLYEGWNMLQVSATRGIKGGRSKAPELLISARCCT